MKKKQALFIVHDVYQDGNYFPLGIGYLAAVLDDINVNVTILNQDVFHYSNSFVEQFLRKNKFDAIGIGFLAARFKETVYPLTQVINRNKGDALLILGGQGASPIPEYMLYKTNADIVTIGEAESTICDIFNHLNSNEALEDINGLSYKCNNQIITNSESRKIKDLDSIPFPLWSKFPMSKYKNSMMHYGQNPNEFSINLITSRGCIGHCNFCYRMEKGIRFRSVENVINEIKILNEIYGISYFDFLDELFLINKNRAFDFLNALEKSNTKIKFACNVRVNGFDEELGKILKEMGCVLLRFGIESMNQKVLNTMKKETSIEENYNIVETSKAIGLETSFSFMWGNKFDTSETLNEIVQFYKKYDPFTQIRTVRPPTPYPGTQIYYEAIKDGTLKDAEDFFKKFKSPDALTINFTEYDDEKVYSLLYKANKELIKDYLKRRNCDRNKMKQIIDGFHKTYFEHDYSFRGARQYGRDE